ncbi:MAG: hypothetical protein PHR11_07675, partial [Candidatus Omnitrophica bacterium]|nr:hypothetical protein [Candidatus Omnitrophota bacterium]
MQVFKFRFNRGLKKFGFWGLLAVSIGCVYWPLLRYPFVADDWLYLHFYLQHGLAASVKRFVLTYHVAASYCPLPSLLSIVLYNLAGLKPVVFRLATLAMVFANALLITRIARHILKDKLLACAAGILFATTAKIHIFPVVSFISGFCEAGVVLFFCSSFIMFVKRRYGLSALFFLLALLTKASAAVLPFVLCAYALFAPQEDRIRPLRQVLYALRFHLLILLAAAFPVIVSPGWRIDAWGPHILENLKYYYQRSLFFLFPRPSVAAYAGVAFLLILLSGASYAFARARREADGGQNYY